jgi:hypothetical protein
MIKGIERQYCYSELQWHSLPMNFGNSGHLVRKLPETKSLNNFSPSRKQPKLGGEKINCMTERYRRKE